MVKVFLDAGHGGRDPGALGSGLKEKDINLSVALRVGELLTNKGIEVAHSRTDDRFVDLADRAAMANGFGAHLFLSIHCNGFSNPSARGVETYCYPSNSKGQKLAKLIQDSIVSRLSMTNRGVKEANFAVLRLTYMPAALVEMGFITSKGDAYILKDKQEDLSRAIAEGILNYLQIPYTDDKPLLYRVQVGAFRIRSNAEKLVEELKVKGYDAIIVNSKGKTN